MAERLNRAILFHRNELVAPPMTRACEDRTFEIPPALYLLTAFLFFGFVCVLSFAAPAATSTVASAA